MFLRIAAVLKESFCTFVYQKTAISQEKTAIFRYLNFLHCFEKLNSQGIAHVLKA
jgi:hypothetical protein